MSERDLWHILCPQCLEHGWPGNSWHFGEEFGGGRFRIDTCIECGMKVQFQLQTRPKSGNIKRKKED